MTDFDTPVPSSVTLQCPVCGASAEAETEALADASVIVCANCGETPTAAISSASQSVEIIVAPARPPVLSNINLIDAVRKPLVTYSDAPSDAWAAKLQADRRPPPVRERRLGSAIGAAACVLALLAFVGGRQAAVAAVPDLAGLYAVLGMPVNLYGLEINGVQAERKMARNGPASVVVRGVIVNVSRQAQPIPSMSIGFKVGQDIVDTAEFTPPAPLVGVGAAAPFEVEIKGAPTDAADVIVRFASAPFGVATRLATTALR